MEALGIVLAVGVGVAVLLGILIFVVVAMSIYKTFRKVTSQSDEFQRNWQSRSWTYRNRP